MYAGRDDYQENDVATIISKLTEFNDQLDSTHDVSDVIHELKKTVELARRKQHEMELLSFFAFFSNHETITEQRKQLFFTTKMLYEDKIIDLLKYYDESQHNMIASASMSSQAAIDGKKNTGLLVDLWEYWSRTFRKIRRIQRNAKE